MGYRSGFLECCLEQVEKTTTITLVYFHSALFALDNENGELLWTFQDPSIVSNFVVNDGRVAFLDENAELHILDILTGNSLANIPFSPPPPEARRFASGDNQIGSSLIAYADDIVVIYFGDTAYLSAYQVTLDG